MMRNRDINQQNIENVEENVDEKKLQENTRQAALQFASITPSILQYETQTVYNPLHSLNSSHDHDYQRRSDDISISTPTSLLQRKENITEDDAHDLNNSAGESVGITSPNMRHNLSSHSDNHNHGLVVNTENQKEKLVKAISSVLDGSSCNEACSFPSFSSSYTSNFDPLHNILSGANDWTEHNYNQNKESDLQHVPTDHRFPNTTMEDPNESTLSGTEKSADMNETLDRNDDSAAVDNENDLGSDSDDELVECKKCAIVRNELNDFKKQMTANFQIMKMKVMSTDELISEHHNNVALLQNEKKLVKELQAKLEGCYGETGALRIQLKKALQANEPLKKTVRRFEYEKSLKQQTIDELQIRLEKAEIEVGNFKEVTTSSRCTQEDYKRTIEDNTKTHEKDTKKIIQQAKMIDKLHASIAALKKKQKEKDKALKKALKDNEKLSIKVFDNQNKEMKKSMKRKRTSPGKASKKSPKGVLSPSPSPPPTRKNQKRRGKEESGNGNTSKKKFFHLSQIAGDNLSSSSGGDTDNEMEALLANSPVFPEISHYSIPTLLSPPLSPIPPSPVLDFNQSRSANRFLEGDNTTQSGTIDSLNNSLNSHCASLFGDVSQSDDDEKNHPGNNYENIGISTKKTNSVCHDFENDESAASQIGDQVMANEDQAIANKCPSANNVVENVTNDITDVFIAQETVSRKEEHESISASADEKTNPESATVSDEPVLSVKDMPSADTRLSTDDLNDISCTKISEDNEITVNRRSATTEKIIVKEKLSENPKIDGDDPKTVTKADSVNVSDVDIDNSDHLHNEINPTIPTIEEEKECSKSSSPSRRKRRMRNMNLITGSVSRNTRSSKYRKTSDSESKYKSSSSKENLNVSVDKSDKNLTASKENLNVSVDESDKNLTASEENLNVSIDESNKNLTANMVSTGNEYDNGTPYTVNEIECDGDKNTTAAMENDNDTKIDVIESDNNTKVITVKKDNDEESLADPGVDDIATYVMEDDVLKVTTDDLESGTGKAEISEGNDTLSESVDNTGDSIISAIDFPDSEKMINEVPNESIKGRSNKEKSLDRISSKDEGVSQLLNSSNENVLQDFEITLDDSDDTSNDSTGKNDSQVPCLRLPTHPTICANTEHMPMMYGVTNILKDTEISVTNSNSASTGISSVTSCSNVDTKLKVIPKKKHEIESIAASSSTSRNIDMDSEKVCLLRSSAYGRRRGRAVDELDSEVASFRLAAQRSINLDTDESSNQSLDDVATPTSYDIQNVSLVQDRNDITRTTESNSNSGLVPGTESEVVTSPNTCRCSVTTTYSNPMTWTYSSRPRPSYGRRHSLYASGIDVPAFLVSRLRVERTRSLSPSLFSPPSPPLSPIPPSPRRSILTPIISPLPTTPLPESVSPLPPSPKITSPPLIRGSSLLLSDDPSIFVPKPVSHSSSSAVKVLKFSSNDDDNNNQDGHESDRTRDVPRSVLVPRTSSMLNNPGNYTDNSEFCESVISPVLIDSSSVTSVVGCSVSSITTTSCNMYRSATTPVYYPNRPEKQEQETNSRDIEDVNAYKESQAKESHQVQAYEKSSSVEISLGKQQASKLMKLKKQKLNRLEEKKIKSMKHNCLFTKASSITTAYGDVMKTNESCLGQLKKQQSKSYSSSTITKPIDQSNVIHSECGTVTSAFSETDNNVCSSKQTNLMIPTPSCSAFASTSNYNTVEGNVSTIGVSSTNVWRRFDKEGEIHIPKKMTEFKESKNLNTDSDSDCLQIVSDHGLSQEESDDYHCIKEDLVVDRKDERRSNFVDKRAEIKQGDSQEDIVDKVEQHFHMENKNKVTLAQSDSVPANINFEKKGVSSQLEISQNDSVKKEFPEEGEIYDSDDGIDVASHHHQVESIPDSVSKPTTMSSSYQCTTKEQGMGNVPSIISRSETSNNESSIEISLAKQATKITKMTGGKKQMQIENIKTLFCDYRDGVVRKKDVIKKLVQNAYCSSLQRLSAALILVVRDCNESLMPKIAKQLETVENCMCKSITNLCSFCNKVECKCEITADVECPKCKRNRSGDENKKTAYSAKQDTFFRCHPRADNLSHPILTTFEKDLLTILTAILRICKFSHADDIMLEDIKAKIFSNEQMLNCERLALCRFYTAICRFYKNSEKITGLLFGLAYDQYPHISFPMVFITCYSVWPSFIPRTNLLTEDIENSTLSLYRIKLSPLTAVFQIISLVDSTENKDLSSLKILEKLFSFKLKDQVSLHEYYAQIAFELYSLLLIPELSFMNKTQSTLEVCPFVFSTVKAIELLCKRLHWEWTYNELIVSRIWCTMKSYFTGCSNYHADTIAIIIQLSGHLCRYGTSIGSDLSKYALLLISVLETLMESEDATKIIEDSIVNCLMVIAPIHIDLCELIFKKWFANAVMKKQPIPDEIMKYISNLY